MEKIYEYADYLTINISSPNTKELRKLHQQDRLSTFLENVKKSHESLERKHKKLTPLFLKISPDINQASIASLSSMIKQFDIHGVIATNTTIDKDIIQNKIYRDYEGGVSGKPLFVKSNSIVKQMRDKLPDVLIIGCGGINSKKTAQEKINQGCDLVQIYTGLIYKGTKVINEITS